jgi:hypothetical protein
MSPWKRVRIGALLTILCVLGFAAARPARAQLYEQSRRALDLTPDPLERSPRLLGMGRLTVVGDDPHYRLTLWDFGGNPAGVPDADSISSFELRPGTAATSSVHRLLPPDQDLERQDLAGRDIRLGYEAWYRRSGSTAWGGIGDFGLMRIDQPSSGTIEQHRSHNQPSFTPIIAGAMPFAASDRLRYALRLTTAYETSTESYQRIVRNAVGEYIDQNGDVVDPPNFFNPVDFTVNTLGVGAAVAYRFGTALNLAAGADHVGNHIEGTNEGTRYSSSTEENRPYTIGQSTLVGRIGSLEYGVDGRAWSSQSNEGWRFSLSTGPASTPVAGRGNLDDRRESGHEVRSRFKLTSGSLVLGAAFNQGSNRITIHAPDVRDPTSFNRFRNDLFYLPGSDTLAIPDSIVSNERRERGWDGTGGLGWRFGRGFLGGEFHALQDRFEQTVSGAGPERRRWEVRAGAEYDVNRMLTIRAGGSHGRDDHDRLTKNNEYLRNGINAGLGFAPPQSRLQVDLSYEYEWIRADFGDPGTPHADRQQFVSRLLWRL